MAVMSYIQRRRSGVYEFRKRLPQVLAGKPAPAHMRGRFPDLINASTGQFKHEFVQSLDTKEAAAAKKQAHRTALRLALVIEDAEASILSQTDSTQPATINPKEIGEAVYRRLLADDEAERLMGDDRRRTVLSEYGGGSGTEVIADLAVKWPDLEPLRPASGFGMQVDHAEVYADETQELWRRNIGRLTHVETPRSSSRRLPLS